MLKKILDNRDGAERKWASLDMAEEVKGAFGEAWTQENFFWAMTILDSRSIWWGGKRNLVPLLDLINCQDGPEGSTVHKTELDGDGVNAVTLAPWNFGEGEQVFENYGQPNHVYFMYHGFVLEENAYDCSLMISGIHETDEGIKGKDMEDVKQKLIAGGFRSYSPEFCVSPASIEEEVKKLLTFLEIKNGRMAAARDVNEYVDRELSKYRGGEGGDSYADKCMGKIVQNEKRMLALVKEFMKVRGDEL